MIFPDRGVPGGPAEAYLPEIMIGIGIATGDVVAGNVEAARSATIG